MQVGNSLLLSEMFHDLHHGAAVLYLCMCMEAGGKPEFVFPEAAAKKYGFARNSFERYRGELIKAGVICVKSSGKATREKNIYAFQTGWKSRPP